MSENNNKRIEFDFDNDNRPIGESVVEGKLFEPQYKQALHQIDIYLQELDMEKTEKEERDRSIKKADTEYIPDDIDYNNNIFSFIGGRGTGKTSCMISVANVLQSKDKKVVGAYENIARSKFTTIDLIDPAYFDKSHNLLSLFLAKLYKSYVERAENEKHTDVARSDKQDFLRIYREAHAQLHRLYHDKDNHAYSDEDLMEFVEEVSASVNLKRTIQDLVDAYFKCFGWKDTMLILRVDDVDMDIHQASEMIESMRKYFVQPNILVFVSCDIEQLEKIKIGDFRKELEDKEVTTWHKELADRYLAKVFPHSHRIQMPEPASYHNRPLLVKGTFKTEAGADVDKDEIQDDEETKEKKTYRKFVSVKQAIPELILRKTRYLFYNTNYYESYIVPRNLRELRQLMKLLITMRDYDNKKDEPRHNKTLFKEYFYDTWVQHNLSVEDQHIVERLRDIRDLALLNETLLDLVNDRFYKGRQNVAGGTIINNLINQSSSTTSDVLSIITLLEPTLIQEQDRKLIFFIKSYYSMLLYDSYRDMIHEFDEKGNRPKERVVTGTDGKTDNQIIRRDANCEFYDYEKLVGGSFVLLHTLQQDALVHPLKLQEIVERAKQLCAKDSLEGDEEAIVLLAELIVLSISYVKLGKLSDRKHNRFDKFKKIAASDENDRFVVNVGALLFNITRYEQSIRRYDDELFKAFEESKCYKNFRKRIMDEANVTDDIGYSHRIALRNFEVLQDIFLLYERQDYPSLADRYYGELKFISKYAFPLYEHPKGQNEHYNISLTFLDAIVGKVSEIWSDKKLVDDIFDQMSNDEKEAPTNVTGSSEDNITEPAAKADDESPQKPEKGEQD